ncbi:hypothetical protein [Stenotrophomonas phage CM2]
MKSRAQEAASEAIKLFHGERLSAAIPARNRCAVDDLTTKIARWHGLSEGKGFRRR